MFKIVSVLLSSSVVKYSITNTLTNTQLSWKSFAANLQGDGTFRTMLAQIFAQSSYDAFFWECAPVIPSKSETTNFEFVLVKSNQLSGVDVDLLSFSQYFSDSSEQLTVSFSNLGGDALLVVPKPENESCEDNATAMNHFAHLAAFVRHGEKETVDALLKEVGNQLVARFENTKMPTFQRPMWLSTSGLGVYYVHVRIDSTPKYYQYSPFKVPPK